MSTNISNMTMIGYPVLILPSNFNLQPMTLFTCWRASKIDQISDPSYLPPLVLASNISHLD